MAERMTASQLDGLEAIHECEHCEGGAHCVTRGLINEVRESWVEHAEAKRLLLEALRQRVDARAERDRLRDALRALASLAEEAKRHVPHGTDLRSGLEVDLADVRTLLDGVDGCCGSDHHGDDVIEAPDA